jgi:hypothetical protein
LRSSQRFTLTTVEGRLLYAVQNDDAGTGRLLCTDYDPQSFEVLEYTGLVTDTTLYDGDFESALAWGIAAELALGLKKDPRLWATCLEAMRVDVATAASVAWNSQPTDLVPTDSIRARG